MVFAVGRISCFGVVSVFIWALALSCSQQLFYSGCINGGGS